MCLESNNTTVKGGESSTRYGDVEISNTYVDYALEQYALLLIRYYRGITLKSLDEIPQTLSHRMIFSEFNSDLKQNPSVD